LRPPLRWAEPPEKSLTVQDMMKFRQISETVISEDGRWAAYALEPDRRQRRRSEHGRAVLHHRREAAPVFSRDGRWLAALVKPRAVEAETEAG
jgi:hypothetical protein